MTNSKGKNCCGCDKLLNKDEIALNKKLFGKDVNEFMCLDCMSENLGCEIDDLQIKIDEFKEQGCTLFI